MTRIKVLTCLIAVPALATSLNAAPVPTPAPSFTISASNVTMPSSGTVPIPFTLTSVNGFAGMVSVTCVAPTEPMGVTAPYCDQGGPVLAYTLAADGTATGSISIIAIEPNPVPLATRSGLARHSEGSSWAMAGLLVIGIGLRRKRARQLTGVSLGVGVMIVLAGIGLCGCGGPPTLTPGAYVFKLKATSVSITPSMTASTTSTITVPAGIVTKPNN